jgi:NADH:ubiquinone oxidoreductase subunit 6 (subunit J)
VALSAGFVAVLSLVAWVGIGLTLGREQVEIETLGALRAAQYAGVIAAAVFVVLAYTAVRLDFHHGAYPGGGFGAAILGRLLFTRDLLALEASAGVVLVAVVATFLAPVVSARR